MNKKDAAILMSMELDAWESYEAGEDWDYLGHVDITKPWVRFDEGEPILFYLVTGYSIRDVRKLTHELWSCDEDACLEELYDACGTDEEDYDKWLEQYSEESRRDSVRNYLKWVVKHGTDPLEKVSFRAKSDSLVAITRALKKQARIDYCRSLIGHEEYELASILMNGWDKQVWLVAADWLEEHGDARHELVRNIWR